MFNGILVIIGTIIGAGFASGKEIFTFFNVYGKLGLLGLMVSQVLICFVIYKTFCIILKEDIISYPDFISKTITKSPFINSVICNIMNIFLLISFIVMVAGFAAFFSQELKLSYMFGAFLISVLCFLTFLGNIDGIVKVNKLFIPLLILIILLLGITNLKCFVCFNFYTLPTSYNWLISTFLYSSYNLVILIPILISLKKYVKTIKDAKLIAIFTTFFLCLMSMILFFLLNYNFIEIANLELPIIYIASKLSILFKYICSFAILGAIFTTAISSGYSFLTTLNIKNRKKYFFVSALICIVSILLSNIGFSNLLNILYPIMGFLRINTNRIYSVFFKNTLKILLFTDINM